MGEEEIPWMQLSKTGPLISTYTAAATKAPSAPPNLPVSEKPAGDPGMTQRFRTNSEQFQLLSQALGNTPSEAVEGQLPSLKDSARSAYRMTTGRAPN